VKKKSKTNRRMKKEDRTRLRREYEYLRGCSDMISWIVLTDPTDDQIEIKLDKMKGRMETITTMLKKLETIN
jgi:hypothetical protein